MDRKTNLWDYKLNCEGQYVHFLLSEAPCRARGEGSKEQGTGRGCTLYSSSHRMEKEHPAVIKKNYQNSWEKISSLNHSFLLRQSHFDTVLTLFFKPQVTFMPFGFVELGANDYTQKHHFLHKFDHTFKCNWKQMLSSNQNEFWVGLYEVCMRFVNSKVWFNTLSRLLQHPV